jgi:hypothetical protein
MIRPSPPGADPACTIIVATGIAGTPGTPGAPRPWRCRGRWSRALADLAVAQRPENRGVLAKWVTRWAARADDAALGLGTILEAEAGVPADEVAARARTAREQFLAGLLGTVGENGSAQTG